MTVDHLKMLHTAGGKGTVQLFRAFFFLGKIYSPDVLQH